MNFISMMQTNEFGEMTEKCKEISKSEGAKVGHRLLGLLRLIFPCEKMRPLASLYVEAVNSKSTKWVDKIQRIVHILSANSEFGETLIVNRDLRIDLHQLSLGNEYESFFSERTVAQTLNLKKEMNILTVPLLEGFFIKLVSELLVLKQEQRKSTDWREAFQLDEYHFYMLRNPILHVIRQWITETRVKPVVYNRILNVLEYVLMKEPLFRFRRNECGLSIKTYHFYGIYLLVQWRITSTVWQFLEFVVEYLEIKQKNFNLVFCAWIRMHLILMNKGSKYELEMRKELEEGGKGMALKKMRINANSLDDIQRFSFQVDSKNEEFLKFLKHLQFQIDNLLSKEYWTPTPQFLSTLLSILFIFRQLDLFETQSLVAQIGRSLKKFQISIKRKDEDAQKILNDIVIIYRQSVKDEQDFDQEDGMNRNGGSRSSLKEQENKRSMSSLSNSRRSFVNHQRQINPWEHPIKRSQSHLFYLLAYYLSKGIDTLTNKRSNESKYPTTNLRFLASIKVWIFLIALILILLFYP